jgi:hypothetical protein
MVNTMGSIAYGSYDSVEQKEIDHLEVLAGEHGDTDYVLVRSGHAQGAMADLQPTRQRLEFLVGVAQYPPDFFPTSNTVMPPATNCSSAPKIARTARSDAYDDSTEA